VDGTREGVAVGLGRAGQQVCVNAPVIVAADLEG